MAIMPSLMMYSTTLQVSKSGDVYFSVGSTVASKMMPLTDIVAGPRDVFFPKRMCLVLGAGACVVHFSPLGLCC